MTTTRISVEIRDGRHQVRSSPGLLRAQRLHGPVDRARVALVGQTALLLGGDRVGLDVEVGPGATLELSDIAGTVAYHGRGRAASWHTSFRLGLGARLSYAGEPLVVSDGADVTRSLTIDLAEGATARVRETVVFGRAGETGGRLDADLRLRREGEEFCRERLLLDAAARSRPGILAGVRVVDSVLRLGGNPSTKPGLPDSAPSPGDRGAPRAEREPMIFQLLDAGSTLTRYLGDSPAASSLGEHGRRPER